MTTATRMEGTRDAEGTISLVVRQRAGRWWIVFATTPLLQLGPEVTTARTALQKTRALYPRFVVDLE